LGDVAARDVPRNREGDRLLFDVAEGTQRQMIRFSTGFAISDVFLTHLHGDHVLGLPGLLQTLDFNERDDPLTIHAPRGTHADVVELATVANTDPSFPVEVREVAPGEIAVRREDYEVRAVAVDHRTSAVGYALVEDERKGRFDRERAEELGVPVGPKFGQLHEGSPVELEDGTVIDPEQVVGPPRPGRSVVYTGDTRSTASVAEAAEDADLLIHDATFAEEARERAGETGHSTAKQAAEIARRAGVDRLALTHLSSRYAGGAEELEREASEVFDGEAFVPNDGELVEIPYRDS
jgi:ribonuclease Z